MRYAPFIMDDLYVYEYIQRLDDKKAQNKESTNNYDLLYAWLSIWFTICSKEFWFGLTDFPRQAWSYNTRIRVLIKFQFQVPPGSSWPITGSYNQPIFNQQPRTTDNSVWLYVFEYKFKLAAPSCKATLNLPNISP